MNLFLWDPRTFPSTFAGTLAQGLGPIVDGPPPPPALPSPPIFEAWLLEGGLKVPLLILALGCAAFFMLRSLGRPKHGPAVLILALVGAAAAWLLSRLVVTDREAIAAESRALVGAAARADAGELDRLLAADVNLFAVRTFGKDEILDLTRERLGGPWKLKSWGILELQAAADSATRGQTQLKVRVVPEATGFPDISWWRLDWRRDPEGWRVIAIEPVAVNNGIRGEMR